MATPFNQGAPSVPVVLSSSNVFVFGNTASGTALSVQQLGTGNVFAVSNTSGTGGLFVNARSNVGIGTSNPTSQLHVYSLSGVQNQTGQGAAQIVNCGGLPLNINYTGTGGALNYAIYSVSGSSSASTVNKLFRYIGSVLSDGSSGNLGGLHVEGIIGGGGAAGNACYLKADFTNRGTSGGYKYSQLTGGTVDSTMNIFMVSNTSSTNYDLYIQYGNSGYNGFNLDIKSTWNTFNFINIEGTADPRTAPTSYATAWDLLGTANFVQKGSNGNVGIGTANPLVPLHVYSSGGANFYLDGTGIGGTTGTIEFRKAGNQVADLAVSNAAASWSTDAQVNDLIIRTQSSNVMINTNGGSGGSGLCVSGTTGRVGIGTANPQTQLDVFGNVRSYNMTQINKNTGVGNGVALGNLLFTVSWDTAQGDGQNPIIIEVTQTVGLSGGGYYTRVAHVFICSFNDNSTNPAIFSSAQISTSSLNITATPTISNGGRAGTTSVTVTTTPGYASTASNKSYSIHARVICVPPSVGNIYFA